MQWSPLTKHSLRQTKNMSEHCLLWIDAEEASIRKGQGTRWQQMPHLIPQGVFSVGEGRGSGVAAFCHTKSLRTQRRQRSCALKNRVQERRKPHIGQQWGREYALRPIWNPCGEFSWTLVHEETTRSYERNHRNGTEPWGTPAEATHRQTSARVTMNGPNRKTDPV